MKSSLHLLLLSVTLCFAQIALATPIGFSSIKCGMDIPNALLGKPVPNEKVIVLEGRYKSIGLRNLGATEISENIVSISWLICGSEYMLLQDKRGVVRDVLPFPPHSKVLPEFIGICALNGKPNSDVIVAVLDSQTGREDLATKVAWKIDKVKVKFVRIPEDGIRCPRSGIATVDGGL
jgi:hypothetical protein